MECSNVGICNRSMGTCTCPLQFTGQSCQRLACPNDCSSNGICSTLKQAAEFYGYTSAGLNKYSYANWEGNTAAMCICDWGFTGPDCSMKMCPKGDDPNTVSQNYRAITMTTSATATALTGTFRFSFQGESFSFAADASTYSAANMATALEALPNIEDVTVTQGVDGTTKGAVYTITFIQWPALPSQNNIFTHDGNPSITADFSCDTTGITSGNTPTCTFADAEANNLREYAYCSRRGDCDFSTGKCTCHTGYTGVGCGTSPGVVTTTSDVDVLLLHASASDYTGNTERASDSAFNLLKAESNSVTTLTVRGDGDVTMSKGGLTIAVGGETITAGGLTITAGGETITDGGLVIAAKGQVAPTDLLACLLFTALYRNPINQQLL
ncbi:unnamed protein product [Chrysoparadoxa australica]